MRAEIEPVKVRPACLFQEALHFSIDRVNLLLGDQAASDHGLVTDHNQLKARLFQTSEGLRNTLQDSDVGKIGQQVDVLDEHTITIQEDGYVHGAAGSMG
jgi:hypothetical protein